jgi:hypothetical protein
MASYSSSNHHENISSSYPPQNLTFVTSFMDIYETTFEDKTIEWRFEKFRDIAETGIQLCVYVNPECHDILCEFSKPYSNVKIMKSISLADTFVSKSCLGVDYVLPAHRNIPKDIPAYMMLINSKTEFLYDAVEKNPWNSTHFAWIDFSISYVFHKKDETMHYLRTLSKRTFSPTFLAIPGCWDKLGRGEMGQISNGVYWRFCGGFFIGDAVSIKKMHNYYLEHYPQFIRSHKHLVWEVNFWAWLEANTEWNPTWYKADHNDCILHIPTRFCSVSLNDELKKTFYEYPKLPTYEPSSACYVYYNGKHCLNTRYVNYWYLDSGHCSIKHPEDFIISRNMYSELDERSMVPVCYNEMKESSTGLTSKRCYFYGLEDIRLYVFNDRLRFIATNIDYSPTGYNRMVVGNYHPETESYSNCIITEPPYENWCEKNWIPLIKSAGAGAGEDEEFFIYKWFPLEIGKLNAETRRLEIVQKYNITAPDFHRARGSTPFVDTGDCLVGIVHFSENTLPRQYYHIMVSLDRQTLAPLKYSQTFHFQHIGIEFCIGFTMRNGEYIFWISKMDREPAMVSLSVDKIPLIYDF